MPPRELTVMMAHGVSSPPQIMSCSSSTATTTKFSGLERQSATDLEAAFMKASFLSPIAMLVWTTTEVTGSLDMSPRLGWGTSPRGGNRHRSNGANLSAAGTDNLFYPICGPTREARGRERRGAERGDHRSSTPGDRRVNWVLTVRCEGERDPSARVQFAMLAQMKAPETQ